MQEAVKEVKAELKKETSPQSFSLTLLGSKPEEGYPRKDCTCPQCEEAKKQNFYKFNTSLLLEANGSRIVIDWGEDWKGKLDEIKPDVIILTHTHSDHAYGLLDGATIPVYLSRASLEHLKKALLEDIRLIEPEQVFTIGPFTFIPHLVKHSKLETLCFEILVGNKKIIYAPDCLDFEREEYLKNADLVFMNGSAYGRDIRRGDGIGHMDMLRFLRLAEKYKIKRVCFCHIGHIRKTRQELQDELRERFKDVWVGKDGLRFVFENGLVQKSPYLPVFPSGKKMGKRIYLTDVLGWLDKSFYISKPAICVTGGVVNNGYTDGDIDIVFLSPRKEPQAEFRLIRAFPEELRNRVHILYPNVDITPPLFTSNVPLYDLKFERRELPEKISLSQKEVAKDRVEVIKQRAIPEKEPEAKQSMKEDKVVPFRFFYPLKAVVGYRAKEEFGIEAGLALLEREAKFPYMLDLKADGARVSVHKVKDRIQILSMSGMDWTERFPTIVKELLTIPHDFIIDCEITGIKNGDHIGRGQVSGYANAKTSIDDKWYTLNIFDILYFNGRDLHKEPLQERLKVREKLQEAYKGEIGLDKSINFIKYYICNNIEEAKQALEDFFDREMYIGTEGSMIKELDSDYPLDGFTAQWGKCKIEFDGHAEVVASKKVKGTDAYNYWMITRKNGEPVPLGKSFNVRIDDHLGNPIRLADGSIATMVFTTISRYVDKKLGKIHLRLWSPRCVDWREDLKEPDDFEHFNELVEKSLGEVAEKSYPPDFIEIFKVKGWWREPEKKAIKKAVDVSKVDKEWLDKASYEDLRKLPKGFFVLTDHFRGKSMHGDLRIKQDEHLIGMTLLYQEPGLIEEPVTTLKEAERIQREQPRKFYPDMPTDTKIMAEEKGTQPLVWLSMVKRVVPKGGIGATKDWPGVFNLYDFGMSYEGTQKPYFSEIFLDGQKFKKKRLVMRVLQVGEEWKKKPAEEWVWSVWLAKDEPYILTRRAILEKKTIPPEGEAWLPPWWKEKIPKDLSWWVKGLSEEEKLAKITKARNHLVTQGELPGKPIAEEEIEKQKREKKGRFILRSHFWEGPFVKRGMPIIHYDLVIDRGLGYLHEWNLQKSPLVVTSTFGLERICEKQTPKGENNVKWMEFEGSIPPPNISIYPVKLIERLDSIYKFEVPEEVKPIDVKKKIEPGKEYESKDCPYEFKPDEKVWADDRHYLYNSTISIGNPNVAIPAYMLIEDSGEVVWLEETPAFDSFIFKGKRLKGYWIWKNEEPGSELGTFELSELPGS